ncbi:unnamed protein product, partial [Linum tenue]
MVGKVLTIGPRSWRNSSRCGRTDNGWILSLQLEWVEWGYHDPYLDRYRQTSVRYMTPEGVADGALADWIERIKDMTAWRVELGNEDVSFIR